MNLATSSSTSRARVIGSGRHAAVVATWVVGLVLLAAGIASVLAAGVGVGPLDVAGTALAQNLDIAIGWAIAALAVLLVVLTAVIGGRVGVATIATALLIGPAVAIWLEVIVMTTGDPVGMWRWFAMVGGLLLIACGASLQISSGWGPSPVDALAVAIVEFKGWQLRWVRTGMELTLVAVGGLAGGALGVGTVVVAVGVGPTVAVVLRALRPLRIRLGTTAPGDASTAGRQPRA